MVSIKSRVLALGLAVALAPFLTGCRGAGCSGRPGSDLFSCLDRHCYAADWFNCHSCVNRQCHKCACDDTRPCPLPAGAISASTEQDRELEP
jgi:hypothetical protein